MPTPTMEGLFEELECYERELEKAIANNDEKRIAHYEERIRQVQKEIDNLKYHDNFYKNR